MMRFTVLIIAFLSLFITSCTRSLNLEYNEALDTSVFSTKHSIGITNFDDERSWESKYIAKQDMWKFGITHNNRNYYPIRELVPDLFVQEFRKAGLFVKKVNKPAITDDKIDVQPIIEQEDVEYLLTGKIINFEFENETGWFTVTTQRKVTLALSLYGNNSEVLFFNKLFNEKTREGEGMLAMHSTNVDKLFHVVFKKVLTDVAKLVAEKMNTNTAEVEIHLQINGQYQFICSFSNNNIQIASIK